MSRLALLAGVAALCAVPAQAQEATKADPKHYKVVFEDKDVRIIEVKYGAKEKSVMHEHGAVTAVFVTDAKFKFTAGDGTVTERDMKRGDSVAMPAQKHLPENMGDAAEVILIEWKGTPPPAAPAATK